MFVNRDRANVERIGICKNRDKGPIYYVSTGLTCCGARTIDRYVRTGLEIRLNSEFLTDISHPWRVHSVYCRAGDLPDLWPCVTR